MRQQGANQFDKGLNLDTNPIAIDNHTLTGALNATMVTMNGNELVLQNDMGNAKVDQAQLPEGYVPVGMKEHGGIVYVASYNPLKGESQIGCFPSPQRNISQDDAGTPETGLKPLIQFIEDIDENNIGTIKNVTDRVLLIGENDDIVRTGDKFVITYNNANPCDYEVNYNYIKLRALIINSDGTSIDISDELLDMTEKYSDKVYDGSAQSPIAWGTAEAIEHTSFIRILHNNDSPDNTDYSIHKNKICGKLYLQAELKLPAYINVSLITDVIPNDADHLKLTITPRAYNESGEPWNGNGSDWRGNNLNDYDITVKNGNTVITQVDGSYTVPKDAVIKYIVYPKYNYGVDDNNRPIYGKVESLKRTDIIDISAIGSGEVDFHNSIFRYYNDFATDKFVFDYSLKAYIDSNQISDSYQISELYLELINIKDLYTDSGQNLFKAYNQIASSDIKKINLDTNDYFGNYTKFISFETDIDKGNYYIGRISSKITKNMTPSEDRWYYSDWYAVITSTITNKLYLDSFDNMIIIQDNTVTTNSTPEIPTTITQKVFDLDWEANISREKIVDSSATDISSDSNSTNILTEPPSDVQTARIKYETVKTGIATYKHDIETSVPISENENYGFPFDLSFTVDQANVDYHDDIKYSTEISRTGELTDATVPSVDNQSIPSIEPQSKNKIWYNISNNNLTINYELYSQLFAKLAKNPNAIGETVNDYKFNINTQMPAFIPYMPMYYSEVAYSQLTSVIGPIQTIATNHGVTTQINGEITNIYPKYWFNYALNCKRWVHKYANNSKNRTWMKTHSDQYVGIMDGPANTVTPIELGDEGDETLDGVNGWNEVKLARGRAKSPTFSLSEIKQGILDVFNSYDIKPTILLWYGIVNDWSNITLGEQPESSGGQSIYCIPIMFDEYDEPCVLKQFYLGNKGLLTDIVKNFNSIYVQQPDQWVQYDYWIASNEISKFVYTNNYLVNTSYNVAITTNDIFPTINDTYNQRYNDYNKHINSINNKVEFDNKSLYLPKFKLVNKSFDQNYTDSYSCPDQSVKNAQFLDTNVPVLDSCAIVFDENGQHVVTEAKKVHRIIQEGTPGSIRLQDSYELSNAKFDQPDHAYIYVRNDENGKPILIDCQDQDNSLLYASGYTLGQWGYGIAQALRNNKLMVKTDNAHNRKIIVCNNTNPPVNSTNYWLGNHQYHPEGFLGMGTEWHRNSRRKITDLMRVQNLLLFKTSSSADTKTF